MLTMKRRVKTAILCLVIIAAAAVSYIKAPSVPFHLDDIRTIVLNPGLKDPDNLHAVVTTNRGRPLLYLSYFADRLRCGFEPRCFHITNILLHSACCVVFFFLLLLMGIERWFAFVCAILFSVHPLASEAVVYVSGRAAVMGQLFSLVSLIFYLLFRRNKDRIYGVLCFVFFVFSLLTYPMGIYLVPALWALEVFVSKGRLEKKSILFLLSITLIPAVAYAVYRLFLVGSVGVPHQARTIASNIMTQTAAWLYSLRLVLIPVGLNVDHMFSDVRYIFNVRFLFSLPLLVGFVFFSVRSWLKGEFLGTAAVISLLAYSPLFFAPVDDPVAERRLYFMLPWCIAACAAAVQGFLLRRKVSLFIVRVCISMLVLLFMFSTIARTEVWTSKVLLWRDAVSKSPHKFRPNYNLANALAEKGRKAEAVEYYRRALEIDPMSLPARNNLANLLVSMGRYDDAIEILKSSLRACAGRQVILANLANAYYKKGDFAQAEAIYRKLISAFPSDGRLYYNLGNVLAARGNTAEARDAYMKALEAGFDNKIIARALEELESRGGKRRGQ